MAPFEKAEKEENIDIPVNYLHAAADLKRLTSSVTIVKFIFVEF